MARLLSAFKGSIPRRRVAASLSKVSTGNITDIFSAQDKLLKVEIDALMHLHNKSIQEQYLAMKELASPILPDRSGQAGAGS